jgi:hypothetical protein
VLGLLERLIWCSSKAVFAGMSSFVIILPHPLIEISLQLLDSVINFLAKRYLVELFLNGAMETFANAIGLGMTSFGLGVIDVFDGQV